MEIRYFVYALGYDTNNCITDYEKCFGDFKTLEEARNKFDEVICKSKEFIFNDINHEVAYWHVQIEECECTDEYDECVDVIEETDICLSDIAQETY